MGCLAIFFSFYPCLCSIHSFNFLCILSRLLVPLIVLNFRQRTARGFFVYSANKYLEIHGIHPNRLSAATLASLPSNRPPWPYPQANYAPLNSTALRLPRSPPMKTTTPQRKHLAGRAAMMFALGDAGGIRRTFRRGANPSSTTLWMARSTFSSRCADFFLPEKKIFTAPN